MQGLKATALIIAAAAFALTAAGPAAADSGPAIKHQSETGNAALELRWNTIAAEGQRFQDRLETADKTAAIKSRDFMAMAMAARETK